MFLLSLKHRLTRTAAALCLGAGLTLATQASPRVSLPNGELTDSNTDIQVKVLGSAITIQRTWVNGRWYLNPAWAPLKFKLDRNDQSVKYIDRAGSVYERVGNGDIYQFDDHQFIRKTGDQWLWYDRRGNSAYYTDRGWMQDYRNQNDVTVRFGFDALGQITQVRDHFDEVALSFVYTGIQLNTITDRTGRVVRYIWEGSLLKEVRDLDGKSTFYRYDSNGQLIEIKTPENRITKVTYLTSYSAGAIASPIGVSFSGRPGRDFRISRVSTFENAEHEISKYDYDYKRDGRIFSVVMTTPLNRKLEYRYDFDGRMVTEINGTTIEYDRRRDGPNVEYVKNERGLITRTERDSYRNVLNVEHPDGTVESWKYLPTQSFVSEYTDQAGVVSKYKYNSRGQIIETREAVATPLERLMTYGYDQYGQMTRMTRRHSITAADAALDATSTYVYDNYGNVTEAKDPENNVVKMPLHDVMGNTLTMIDARNKTRTMQYSKQGWLLKSVTALGFISESKYNLDGDRLKSIGPIDGTRTAMTQYFYDNDGRLIRTLDPLGGESKQHYDDEGRMDESTDARLVKTKLEYDGRGRMLKVIDGNLNETETVYGDNTNALEGLVSSRIYPTNKETYKYDQMDRQVENTQVLSPTLSYVSSMNYDAVGQVVNQVDAKGRTSLRYYDVLRRLTKEVDPILGETKYSYDERDNLLTVTDANDHTHTFTYDRLNRKLTEARPMGQTISYRYDPNGNLLERLSPNGAKRKFKYDDDNRLELEEHFLPATTVPSKTMSYQYDQRGLLKSYDDGLTAGAYVYNDKGEKTSEAITFGRGAAAFTKTIGRTYELNGLPKSMTYPGATGTLNFTYDDNNQLKTYKIPGLTAGSDTLTYQYRWNAVKEITMPGNLKRTVTLGNLLKPPLKIPRIP